MISKLSCKGYRGFATQQTLELAVPNGERGSGLTVLVGPNGGGKSALLECFYQLQQQNPSVTVGKRNKKAGDEVCIEVTYDDGNESMGTLKTLNGGSETKWFSDSSSKPKIYYLQSRRVFDPYFNKIDWDRNTYIENPERFDFRGQPSNKFSYRLFDANKNSDEFNKIFWDILGEKLEWTIDQSDIGRYYVKVNKKEDIYHNSDGLGEGIVSLLFIVDSISGSNNDELVVIDEPELSLHPQLQNRLLDKLLEVTQNKQVVIATHSVNMISNEAIANGGTIARVFESNEGSVIKSLDENCRNQFKSYMKNINNPHIMGNDAKACFFAEDGFIITEGQEDVVLYPLVIKELDLNYNFSFFGFGAGGANNITKIASIFKCLGFSNIGAIFDGDQKERYEQFNTDYADVNYKAWIIPADDIRDKDERNIKGLLDENLKLKVEFKDELMKIFKEINKFSSNHR